MIGAERPGARKFRVRGGRDDDDGAGGFGELQRGDRHAAGSLHHDDVAGRRGAGDEQRAPGGERGAGEGCSFQIADLIRQARQSFGRKHRVLAGDAVHGGAELLRILQPFAAAADPSLREQRRDAIADGDAGHAGADGFDLTGGARQRGVDVGGQPRQLAGHEEEVAVIQGRRMYPHQRFARAGLGDRALLQLQRLDAGAGACNEAAHAGPRHVSGSRRRPRVRECGPRRSPVRR